MERGLRKEGEAGSRASEQVGGEWEKERKHPIFCLQKTSKTNQISSNVFHVWQRPRWEPNTRSLRNAFCCCCFVRNDSVKHASRCGVDGLLFTHLFPFTFRPFMFKVKSDDNGRTSKRPLSLLHQAVLQNAFHSQFCLFILPFFFFFYKKWKARK